MCSSTTSATSASPDSGSRPAAHECQAPAPRGHCRYARLHGARADRPDEPLDRFPNDLYSLGITFYEMLTGTYPSAPSIRWNGSHCHIARTTGPPSERVIGVPQLSAIVMMLLAKAAEERYQTTAGLEADLQRCLTGMGGAPFYRLFPLGVHDVSDVF